MPDDDAALADVDAHEAGLDFDDARRYSRPVA